METITKTLVEKFIYSCSHDLRGPVATIQGLVRLADEHPQDVDPGHCIKMIGECNQKLDLLITSLQEYMINEAHQVQLESINANEIVEDTIHEFSDQLINESIVVEAVTLDGNCVTDRYVFSRMLRHLISNAITFSDPSKAVKKVKVGLQNIQRSLTLEVSDNGLGIPEKAQSKIFEIFYRAHKSSTGSGIGLFLVKGLAEKLRATIRLSSIEGRGTSLMIRLPD
jgi:signal transduction histidine kinase